MKNFGYRPNEAMVKREDVELYGDNKLQIFLNICSSQIDR